MCVGGDNFDIEKQFGVQALVKGRKVLMSPKWKLGKECLECVLGILVTWATSSGGIKKLRTK